MENVLKEVSSFAKELLAVNDYWGSICFIQKRSSCLIASVPEYPYTNMHINSTNLTLWLVIQGIHKV